MTSESPWVVLARRLWFEVEEHKPGEFRLADIYDVYPDGTDTNWVRAYIDLSGIEDTAHDLLVGRTMRVSWEKYGDFYGSIEWHQKVRALAESVFQCGRNPDDRATACLQLLDAVEYPASS